MNEAYISIVTRTFNRPATLNRLLHSLQSQTSCDFEWIIVNDCGEPDPVNLVGQEAVSRGVTTRIVHNEIKRGRSFAANLGVRNASGTFAVILDDDDFVSPDFIKTIAVYLRNNQNVAGVTCWSQVVNEAISDSGITMLGYGNKYAPTYYDVSILNMFTSNIPTCGFVFKRELFTELGGYPEDVDCTEDWAFNCAFILKYNIFVIPEVLAYISNRVNPTGSYENTKSTSAGIEMHMRDEIMWKNNLLRKYLSDNDPAILMILFGSINMALREMSLMQHLQADRSSFNGVFHMIERIITEKLLVIKRSLFKNH